MARKLNIAIIGTGETKSVGFHIARELAKEGKVIDQLHLCNPHTKDKIESLEANLVRSATKNDISIKKWGDYNEIPHMLTDADVDLIIYCCGKTKNLSQEERADLIKQYESGKLPPLIRRDPTTTAENLGIASQVFGNFSRAGNPQKCTLNIANPVNACNYAIAVHSRIDPHLVYGLQNIDSIRFRSILAKEFKSRFRESFNPDDIRAFCYGSHGAVIPDFDSISITSETEVAKETIDNFCADLAFQKRVKYELLWTGWLELAHVGTTSASAADAAVDFVKAFYKGRDENGTISPKISTECFLGGSYFGMPGRFSQGGIFVPKIPKDLTSLEKVTQARKKEIEYLRDLQAHNLIDELPCPIDETSSLEEIVKADMAYKQRLTTRQRTQSAIISPQETRIQVLSKETHQQPQEEKSLPEKRIEVPRMKSSSRQIVYLQGSSIIDVVTGETLATAKLPHNEFGEEVLPASFLVHEGLAYFGFEDRVFVFNLTDPDNAADIKSYLTKNKKNTRKTKRFSRLAIDPKTKTLFGTHELFGAMCWNLESSQLLQFEGEGRYNSVINSNGFTYLSNQSDKCVLVLESIEPSHSISLSGTPLAVIADETSVYTLDLSEIDNWGEKAKCHLRKFDKKGKPLLNVDIPEKAYDLCFGPQGEIVVGLRGRVDFYDTNYLERMASFPLPKSKGFELSARRIYGNEEAVYVAADYHGRKAFHLLESKQGEPAEIIATPSQRILDLGVLNPQERFHSARDMLEQIQKANSFIVSSEKPRIQKPKSKKCMSLGGYEIIEELGRNSLCITYKVRDMYREKIKSMKLFPRHLGTFPELIDLFQSAAAYNGADVQTEGNVRYFVTDLIDGHSLGDELNSGPIPIRRGLYILDAVAQDLQRYYHRTAKKFHGGVRPSNILVEEEITFKLGDPIFNEWNPRYAKCFANEMAQVEKERVYVAPEQIRDEVPVEHSDVYSLGVIANEVFTGVPTTCYNPEDRNPRLRLTFNGLLDSLVLACIRDNPQDRVQSVDEFRKYMSKLKVKYDSYQQLGTFKRFLIKVKEWRN